MASGRLKRSRHEASFLVFQSMKISSGPPPKANPPAQSSSSVEAQPTDTLAIMTGNYIEHA